MAIPRIKTRVPFSKEQKLAILKEGERVSVKPICAKYKISDGRYRYWRKTISGIQPRKQLSSQQKLRILEEGYQNGIKETCGAHEVDPTSYFCWKKKFGFLKSRPIPGKPSRFSKEQALAIIKEAEKVGSKAVREKYGISPSHYYSIGQVN